MQILNHFCAWLHNLFLISKLSISVACSNLNKIRFPISLYILTPFIGCFSISTKSVKINSNIQFELLNCFHCNRNIIYRIDIVETQVYIIFSFILIDSKFIGVYVQQHQIASWLFRSFYILQNVKNKINQCSVFMEFRTIRQFVCVKCLL